MTNLVEKTAAWDCFCAYTNNMLRVEAVDTSEWEPARRLDRLPFNMPFQLVVGPEAADRDMAEAALTTVATSMPRHIYNYFARHHLLAPVQQWVIRRAHPTVTNEETYLRFEAHPSVWKAKDFDLARMARLAAGLTSNSVPVLAVLTPVYETLKASPIRRAEPLVDYPDPRPEETYATPYGVSVVLRAVERRRKFRVAATGYPFNDWHVSFRWVARGIGVGGFPRSEKLDWKDVQPSRGYGELNVGWGCGRQDVMVFARYGDGAYGPPSVISFYGIPNERRAYDAAGLILSIEYRQDGQVIPLLYQNKRWKDTYVYDSLKNVIGFLRQRTGHFRDERFTMDGEWVAETYAEDVPKVTQKVRYFTRPAEPLTLDYEIAGEQVHRKLQSFVPRDRGEFPLLKRRARLK